MHAWAVIFLAKSSSWSTVLKNKLTSQDSQDHKALPSESIQMLDSELLVWSTSRIPFIKTFAFRNLLKVWLYFLSELCRSVSLLSRARFRMQKSPAHVLHGGLNAGDGTWKLSGKLVQVFPIRISWSRVVRYWHFVASPCCSHQQRQMHHIYWAEHTWRSTNAARPLRVIGVRHSYRKNLLIGRWAKHLCTPCSDFCNILEGFKGFI